MIQACVVGYRVPWVQVPAVPCQGKGDAVGQWGAGCVPPSDSTGTPARRSWQEGLSSPQVREVVEQPSLAPWEALGSGRVSQPVHMEWGMPRGPVGSPDRLSGQRLPQPLVLLEAPPRRLSGRSKAELCARAVLRLRPCIPAPVRPAISEQPALSSWGWSICVTVRGPQPRTAGVRACVLTHCACAWLRGGTAGCCLAAPSSQPSRGRACEPRKVGRARVCGLCASRLQVSEQGPCPCWQPCWGRLQRNVGARGQQ